MDYKSLVKHNKALLIFTSAVFLCMVVGWILYALYAHQLIKVIYEGRVGFLNRTISEQAVNSLGFYLRKADTAFIKLHICFFISIALYIFRIMAKNKIWRL